METHLSNRELVRIAGRIRQQFEDLRTSRQVTAQRQINDLAIDLESLQAVSRKLGVCSARRWHASASKLTRAAARTLRNLPFHIGTVEQVLASCQMTAPSLRDLVAELRATQEEFGGLRHCRDVQCVAVVTEPIELEGVYLGAFEIQLVIPELARTTGHGAMRVVALDPNPAASNEEVTHPHVSGERLCPGDAGAAIQAGLAGGRICDLFTLVRSVLGTYNRDSPYVPLEDWAGQPCYDCGYIMSSDGLYWCRVCEYDFCDDCSSYCRSCEESVCSGCLEKCTACEESICPSCMTSCPDCGDPLCSGCLDENACPCVEESEEVEHEDDERKAHEGDEVEPAIAGATAR